MKKSILLAAAVALTVSISGASAEEPKTGPAFETNVLWPFFPGGLVDFRAVYPVANKRSSWRGDVVAGVYSDFAWRFVRDETYGRVLAMGTKVGFRQFLGSGFHIEPLLQLNWRHEEDRPDHPETLDGFQTRFWLFGGYQVDVARRVYVNARAGLGVHVLRTDALGSEEKMWVPAADLNLGIRW